MYNTDTKYKKKINEISSLLRNLFVKNCIFNKINKLLVITILNIKIKTILLNKNKFDKFILHCNFIGTYQRVLVIVNKICCNK